MSPVVNTLSYESLVKYFSQNSRYTQVRVRNNTYALKYYDKWHGVLYFDVLLHGNLVATIRHNSLTLYDGGYRSATTKRRLNDVLAPFNMTVNGDDEAWTVRTLDDHGQVIMGKPFVNDMKIDTDKVSERNQK